MPSQVFEVTLSGTLAGQFVQSVFHFHGNITTGYNVFQESINLLLNLSDNFMTKFLTALPASYTSTSMRCKGVMGLLGPTAILLPGAYVGGMTSGDRTPEISSAQVNPLITWIGTVRPSNTGRTFMPGVAEEDIANMILDPAILALYGTFAADFKDVSATGFGWNRQGAIFTRNQPSHVPPIVAAYDLVDAYQVSPLIGTQRRRLHPI